MVTDKFHSDLLEAIGKSLFQFDTLDDIIYNSLELIYPVNRYLKNTNTSIEKKCGEVLAHFKIKNILPSSIKNLTTGKVSNNEEELRKSFKQRYLEMILRLNKPPKSEYENLLNQSEKHLKEINENLYQYSKEKTVIDFKTKYSKPTNQDERTIIDFYIRCINEQQRILDFIYNGGLKERAVLKSRHFFIKIPLSFIYGYSDYPYESASPFSSGYFNHNLISKSAHRVGDFSFDESYALEEIYDNDKEKFYKKYFKRTSIYQIIQEIEFNLNNLPLSADRVNFLEELIYLFHKKRWVSFYGLALSQIEGLFSEMLEFLPKNIKERSLPNKVNSLRAFYSLSGSYFDYFQYHIPNLRNRFMHGSLDGSEKDKLNSFDFLVDIKFLLNTARQLDSPYISLSNTLNNQNIQISTLEDISIMFDLINKLKPQQKKDLDNNLKEFFKFKFIDTKNLDYYLHSIDIYIDNDIIHLNDLLKRVIGIDLKQTYYNELTVFFDNNEDKLEMLKDELRFHDTKLQKFIAYQIFYANYKKKFPALAIETEKLIQQTFRTRNTEIAKIAYLGNIVLAD